jgi:lactoylglutathione lyase
MAARFRPRVYETGMRYLHTMVRVLDLEAALRFFCQGLGLHEIRRRDDPKGRYTLVFLGIDPDTDSPQVELTHNWDQAEPYTVGRNFGHLAYEVPDIYAACQRLVDLGYTISRPPRDGRMAFVRSPDLVSVELLQQGKALEPSEPWSSMPNTGQW